MNSPPGYRDLEIFKSAKELAVSVHTMTLNLPKYEMFEEGSQIRRSSKAICSLIVEGYGRKRYKNDFVKYLVTAHAECDETLLHLEFLRETGSLMDTEKYRSLHEQYIALSKKIHKFVIYVERCWNESRFP